MKRFLKRYLMPMIITLLVIIVFIVLTGVGGKYDAGSEYSCYSIMFGANYNNGTSLKMFGANALGIIAFILLFAGAVLAYANFKKRNIVVCAIFALAALFLLLMPYTVSTNETANNLIKAMDADGKMTALACTYVSFALVLVTACVSFLSDFISNKCFAVKTK